MAKLSYDVNAADRQGAKGRVCACVLQCSQMIRSNSRAYARLWLISCAAGMAASLLAFTKSMTSPRMVQPR